jgi:hypothetical protein
MPQNNGVYSAPRNFPAQPPGYRPLGPPPQMGGPPPFLPPPNLQPPPLYPGMLPAEPPIGPVPTVVAPANLPEMVYVVTSKFWIRPELLLWCTKGAPVPLPLVTTGSPTDAVPGQIGQPGTQVAFGGGNVSLGYVGGIRIESGGWLDARRIFGVEAGYFALIEQSRDYAITSDPFGNPVIGRPVINAQTGAAGVYLDSLPAQILGGADVILRSEFQGANFDGVLNLIQTEHVRLDGLAGFRYLSLSESLNIYDQYDAVVGGTRDFNGSSIGSNLLTDFDGFKVTNSFYGGAAGARLYFAQGRWSFSALGKVAWGTDQERATISGSTTFTDQNGNQTTLPGGILATKANIGSYYQSPWAVAPEGRFNIAYQITPRVTARIGYSFIYLSNVARPGNQMSPVTSASRVPSDPAYGTAGPALAAFRFQTSTYWAQGLNFGLDVRF